MINKIVEQLQNLLITKSTTFVRCEFDKYCKEKNIPERDWKNNQKQWRYSQYDCKRRLRTICVLFDGKQELNIVLRKKAGYYFLIEINRKRIFECDPNILCLDEELLQKAIFDYSEIFKRLGIVPNELRCENQEGWY